MTAPRTGACTGKKRLLFYADALAVAARTCSMPQRDGWYKNARCYPYKCTECGFYHVSSQAAR